HRDQASYEAVKNVFSSTECLMVDELINDFPVQPQDIMLTTRYHPHLMAARAGANGYFLKIDGVYYDVKHNLVKSLGSNFLPFDSFDLSNPPTGTSEISLKDPYLVSKKNAIADGIYGND